MEQMARAADTAAEEGEIMTRRMRFIAVACLIAGMAALGAGAVQAADVGAAKPQPGFTITLSFPSADPCQARVSVAWSNQQGARNIAVVLTDRDTLRQRAFTSPVKARGGSVDWVPVLTSGADGGTDELEAVATLTDRTGQQVAQVTTGTVTSTCFV